MSLDIHMTQFSEEKGPDLLSLADALAEAARRYTDTNYPLDGIELIKRLAAWDAARKGSK